MNSEHGTPLPSRRLAALSMLAVVVCVFSACRGAPTRAPREPTAIGVVPMGPEVAPAPPATGVAGDTSSAGVAGGPPVFGGETTAGVAATAVPPLGYIPAPTARPTAPVGEAGPPRADPAIVALAGQVSASELAASVAALGSGRAGGRATVTGETDSAVGWLRGAFEALDGRHGHQVLVEESTSSSGDDGVLVVTLPGIGFTKRAVYVTARLAPSGAAGSGSAPTGDVTGPAALLELARLMSSRLWDATVRLVVFPEDDLAASRDHAARLQELGLPVVGVVGLARLADAGGDATGLIATAPGPTDGSSHWLARHVNLVLAGYGSTGPDIAVAEDNDELGEVGSFGEAGFAAMRLSGDAGGNASTTSSGAAVDRTALAAATRAVLIVVANLALAPPAPVQAPIADGVPGAVGAYSVRWDPVLDPAVAGYWLATQWPSSSATVADLAWVGPGAATEVRSLPAGERPLFAAASADDSGHTSPFGPSAGPLAAGQ